jgi:hypothetical protein
MIAQCLFVLILFCGMPIAAGIGMWTYHRLIGYRKRLLFQAQVEIGNLDSYQRAFKDVYNLTADSASKLVSLNPFLTAIPALSVGSVGFVLIYELAADQYRFIAAIVFALSLVVGCFQIEGMRERQKMAQKYIDMLVNSVNTSS